MAGTVAEVMVETLKASGVGRVYGIPGDSLNGFTDALRRDGGISWEHVRHEEAGGFAAAAEAALTGELAVCAGSCGPGNLHLINGLFDANRSGVPVLAIAAHIPTEEIGGGYFQETHPQQLFGECSVYCELASVPAQVPRLVEMAVRAALQRRGGRCRRYPRRAVPCPVPGWGEGGTQQGQPSDHPGGGGLRRRARPADRPRDSTKGANRACVPGQGVRGVRQPL